MKHIAIYILLIVLLISLLSGTSFAQQSGNNKLRLQILHETIDTSKVKLLIRLGLKCPMNGPEQYKCLQQAYDLSKRLNFRYGLIFGEYYDALRFWNLGSFDEAINKCKRCIDGLDSIHIIQQLDGYPLAEIRVLFNLAGKQEERFHFYRDKLVFYELHGPIENTANCYNGIAEYYSYLADYDKAIEYYMRAMDVYKSFDPAGYTNEKLVIGHMYMEWGNLDKAEVYLKSGLKDLITLNEDTNYFYCYHELGNLCYIRNDCQQALQYYFKEKQYSNGPEFQAINMVSCASVHLQMGSADSARFYLDGAEKIRQKEKLRLYFSLGILEIDYYFYKYYVATGKLDLAQKSLETALREAWSSRYLPLVLKYTNELHSFFLKKGDSLQSLRYLISYNIIRDSLKTNNSQARIATYEIEQSEQQQEKKIDKLQMQKSRQEMYYLISATFLLLVIIGSISRLRYISKSKRILNAEKKKSEELLLNILPYETAEELKINGLAAAKRYEEVTVMFTDFKDFTKASEQMSAEELVKIIHFYFSEFDRIIEGHNIEKIKTIGDSYMCAGGLPVMNETHAVDVVIAALELQEFVSNQKQERMNKNEPWFDIRIGIHTGPVVAGIVGASKFAYDIWGDTVNTASFMEASGEPGKVNISGTTYERVKDRFTCIYRGKLTAKHKGEIDMYFVQYPVDNIQSKIVI